MDCQRDRAAQKTSRYARIPPIHTLKATARTRSLAERRSMWLSPAARWPNRGEVATKGGVAMSWAYVAMAGAFILGGCLGILLTALMIASAANDR